MKISNQNRIKFGMVQTTSVNIKKIGIYVYIGDISKSGSIRTKVRFFSNLEHIVLSTEEHHQIPYDGQKFRYMRRYPVQIFSRLDDNYFFWLFLQKISLLR